MDKKYFELGELWPDLDPKHLQYEASRQLLEACLRNQYYEVLELRNAKGCDVIVVCCGDGSVPSRNTIGIQAKERLAIVYHPDTKPIPYGVYATRIEFPATLHQNQVRQGMPRSLCLYFESWTHVERSWTPQRYLERILWWIKETAKGTLHRNDQPLEQFYFDSKFQVLLPPDYIRLVLEPSKTLILYEVPHGPEGPKIVRGSFIDKEKELLNTDPFMDCIILSIPPVIHGSVQPYPCSLGELESHLKDRGSNVFSLLMEKIKTMVPSNGLPIKRQKLKYTLLIINLAIIREYGSAPEKNDLKGFIIADDLVGIGLASGTLFDGRDQKAYVEQFQKNINHWESIELEPVDVRVSLNRKDARKASGVSEDGAEFNGVLAGVGALGGLLADLWSREGWGLWTIVDDDTLRAHNIVRHIGKDELIGLPKVEAVQRIIEANYPPGHVHFPAIVSKITDFKNEDVVNAIKASSLLIDITTTLEVPRELSIKDDIPRSVSTFITPSGMASVLLVEDKNRKIRLSSLEAQYYRAILNNSFGQNHLHGHLGDMWVGAGCRDISVVLSNELINFHGALLARQIRKLVIMPDPRIIIWSLQDESGALEAKEIEIHSPIILNFGKWQVTLDEGLQRKIRSMRNANLPNETGGVILGYFDQKLNTISLVDVLPAPPDSEADESGFTRGIENLKESIENCAQKTGRIVDYIGEWHSHPRNCSSQPSLLDIKLFAQQAKIMASEGLPVLMAIVGENDEQFFLCEDKSDIH